MNKKVINNATTREKRLYQKDKDKIVEYYNQMAKGKQKVVTTELNLHGYTNLSK